MVSTMTAQETPAPVPTDAAGRVKTAASEDRTTRTIRFPDGEDKALVQVALRLGLTVNDTVRRAVRELAEREQ